MFLIPILEIILNSFPFKVINFHSDNGSEYINQIVVKLLNSLHVSLTKSRARHSNDNALAESKNGNVIRKQLDYMHIPQKWAPLLNEFNCKYLVPYINFHRPCYFVKTEIDQKSGKQIKTYPYELMLTPYEKLKSLENSVIYLKEGVTFEALEQEALAMSDLEAAKQLCKAKSNLFEEIYRKKIFINESIDESSIRIDKTAG